MNFRETDYLLSNLVLKRNLKNKQFSVAWTAGLVRGAATARFDPDVFSESAEINLTPVSVCQDGKEFSATNRSASECILR